MRLKFSRDDDFFRNNAISTNKIVIILLISGIVLLALSIILSNGAGGLTPMQILTLIAVGLIILSIIISFRKRIYTSLFIFGVLLSIYFFEGITLAYFGLVPEPFSYGLATVVYIWVFVNRISHDGLQRDDFLKIFIFIIVSAIFNYYGYLEQLNNLTNIAISRLFSS